MVMTITVIELRSGNILPAKFARWERHGAEYAARIVLFYGNALFLGNAVFGCLHKILRGVTVVTDDQRKYLVPFNKTDEPVVTDTETETETDEPVVTETETEFE